MVIAAHALLYAKASNASLTFLGIATLFWMSAICCHAAHKGKASTGLATDTGIFADDSTTIFASFNDPLRAESFALPTKFELLEFCTNM
jgi:hypothetical protein